MKMMAKGAVGTLAAAVLVFINMSVSGGGG